MVKFEPKLTPSFEEVQEAFRKARQAREQPPEPTLKQKQWRIEADALFRSENLGCKKGCECSACHILAQARKGIYE